MCVPKNRDADVGGQTPDDFQSEKTQERELKNNN